MRIVKLVGKVFSRLTVIAEAGTRIKTGQSRKLWKCRCVCGKEVLVPTTSLTHGNTKSCGCLLADVCRRNAPKANAAAAKARYLGKNVSLVNFQYLHYQKRAKKKGIIFDLDKDEFRNLIESVCFYCGVEPRQILTLHHLKHGDVLLRNGIDRIDSKQGYVAGNVVSCCWRCNRAKRNDTKDDFRDWAIRLGERAKSNLWDIDAEDRLADLEMNCDMLGERFRKAGAK